MYIKHKINNIQTMKFIKSPRQDYTTYFLFLHYFSKKQKKTEASVLNFQMCGNTYIDTICVHRKIKYRKL